MQQLISLFILIFSCVAPAMSVGYGGFYQYRTQLTGCHSTETDSNPYAYLWIPEGTKSVKAVVLSQQNMTEEAIFKMKAFREQMARLDVAEVWVAPAFSQDWNPLSDCQRVFVEMMDSLAAVSSHPELSIAPIVPLGHSAQATFPWNFAAWNAERTLCIVSFHGDAPRTNLCGYGRENIEWGRTRNIDGIPGLMIEGEYEWWEARVNPALAFRMMYPESCISFLCDTGRGHFDCSEPTALYIARFIEKSLQQRIASDGSLRRIDPRHGWLADRYHPDIEQTDGPRSVEGHANQANYQFVPPAPYADYTGDRHDAFWYFDEEMAMLTVERYRLTQGKQRQYVGIEYNGELLPLDNSQTRMSIKFRPEKDEHGEAQLLHLKAVLVDEDGHRLPCGDTRLHMEYVSGPAIKVNDTTFRIYEHEAGRNNPRRSFSITLCAVAEPTAHSKGAVQPLRVQLE